MDDKNGLITISRTTGNNKVVGVCHYQRYETSK